MVDRILALDLGTTTGWALALSPDNVISGTWDLKPKRFEGGGMRAVRFTRYLDELAGESRDRFDRIVFEEVRRHSGVDAAHVYGGLMMTLQAWCERERQIPYAGVPVGAIKKFATEKGNANKAAMIAAVQSWGYTGVTDDNQADAIALAHLAMSGGA